MAVPTCHQQYDRGECEVDRQDDCPASTRGHERANCDDRHKWKKNADTFLRGIGSMMATTSSKRAHAGPPESQQCGPKQIEILSGVCPVGIRPKLRFRGLVDSRFDE